MDIVKGDLVYCTWDKIERRVRVTRVNKMGVQIVYPELFSPGYSRRRTISPDKLVKTREEYLQARMEYHAKEMERHTAEITRLKQEIDSPKGGK